MPIDGVAEGVIRVIAKFLGYIVMQIIIEMVLYVIGKVTLRIITLGKYPPKVGEEYLEGFVQFVGFIVVAILFGSLLIINK